MSIVTLYTLLQQQLFDIFIQQNMLKNGDILLSVQSELPHIFPDI